MLDDLRPARDLADRRASDERGPLLGRELGQQEGAEKDAARKGITRNGSGVWGVAPLAFLGQGVTFGSPDLLWQHQGDGRVAVWSMSGTTRTRGDLTWPDRVPDGDLGWALRGARDMNGDGHPDLIWQHAVDGRLATWLMHGLEMLSGTLLYPPTVADTNWRIVGAR